MGVYIEVEMTSFNFITDILGEEVIIIMIVVATFILCAR
jgi:hypothetical protein